jgi:putative DNA primase/helicase
MLTVVSGPDGKPATIHETYLTDTGTNAPVEPVRMFCPGSVPPGSAVRLAAPSPTLGIAEGIETASETPSEKLHGWRGASQP